MVSNDHDTLTLLDAGGVKRTPPPSYFCDSPKKIMGKVADFFLLFLNIEMEGWELLFEVI